MVCTDIYLCESSAIPIQIIRKPNYAYITQDQTVIGVHTNIKYLSYAEKNIGNRSRNERCWDRVELNFSRRTYIDVHEKLIVWPKLNFPIPSSKQFLLLMKNDS